MNKQLEKIIEFVNTIESSQMTDEQQSFVLSSPLTVIGAQMAVVNVLITMQKLVVV